MKKILVPGRNCQGIFDVHKAGILVDGRNYFRAFYHAAGRAERYILMAGWQFERSVRLLRGSDEKEADTDARMTEFLNALCERNQSLRVFILMWDFSALVSFDKEWFNKFILDLTTNERIYFRFDGRHPLYASHHQKLVVIDGATAFVGGLDFSANSWDDRRHWADNAERVLAGEQYDPYHDVQSFITGPLAWELTTLFRDRWLHAGGGELSLDPPPSPSPDMRVKRLIPLAAQAAAISVTRAQTLMPVLEPVHHVRRLYIDAIDAAERLIYLENQYFSSQAVYDALKSRLADHTRPCPEIVLIVPKRLHTLVEDISLSVIQAKMLRSLTEIAARYDRKFGVYFTAAALKAGGPEKATYIHSKVLLVDDRFLSVGSANITNRSMGMDTELNLSWEANEPGQRELVRSIRRLRANLLAEHTGLRKLSQRKALAATEGLVEFLNRNADRMGCRLRRHTMESFLEDVSWIKDLMPEDLSIDPERPIIEEGIYELISRDKNSIFAKGILLLSDMMSLPQPPEQWESSASRLGLADAGRIPGTSLYLNNRGRFRWYLLAVIGVAVLAWLLLR